MNALRAYGLASGNMGLAMAGHMMEENEKRLREQRKRRMHEEEERRRKERKHREEEAQRAREQSAKKTLTLEKSEDKDKDTGILLYGTFVSHNMNCLTE